MQYNNIGLSNENLMYKCTNHWVVMVILLNEMYSYHLLHKYKAFFLFFLVDRSAENLIFQDEVFIGDCLSDFNILVG